MALIVLSFLPWLNFDIFSVAGTDVPGRLWVPDGYVTAIAGLAITTFTFVGVRFPRLRTASLFIAIAAGACAFFLAAQDAAADWGTGACGVAVNDRFRICRGSSDIVWALAGSPSPALWPTTGVSVFVVLLSGFRLMASRRHPPASNETNEVEIWV